MSAFLSETNEPLDRDKILVIEDDPDICHSIAEILQYEGYEVYTAQNGYEGLEKLKCFKPDLILCDIMMSELDGYQVFDQVKTMFPNREVPLVYVTALSERKNFRMAMEQGADDYIAKPFSVDELRECVKTQISKSRTIGQFIASEIEKIVQNAERFTNELNNRLEKQSSEIYQISLRNSLLENELRRKDEDLVRDVLKITENNNKLENLRNLIESELSKPGLKLNESILLHRLQGKLKDKSPFQKNWYVFQMYFDKSYPGFVNFIAERYSRLTEMEMSIVCAMSINMSTVQLADMFNILPESVRKSKYRIKKKLIPGNSIDLRSFIHSLRMQQSGYHTIRHQT